MVWNVHDIALVSAGAIGAGVALIHGWLTQRLMARPLDALMAGERRFGPPIRRLVPALLHFSTWNWFVGGLALAAAPLLGREARLAVCLLVGSAYLYAVVGNAWATRGRHPGWMAYTLALVLVIIGAIPGGPA